jgi:ComF family protein
MGDETASTRGMSALAESVKDWINAGLGFLYPEICQLCGAARAGAGDGFVCSGCRDQVQFIEPPICQRCGRPFPGQLTTAFECSACQERKWAFETARSAVVARGPVLEVIHRYKYQRALWFEPFLGGLLAARAGPELAMGRWDCLVPVPLHPAKEREREFNQAERLARCLGAATQIPLNTRLLRRVLATRTQTELSREERLANVAGAFALRHPGRLEAARIVVVDDVFTTGATTGACARVLRAAGADAVCVWTVARGV